MTIQNIDLVEFDDGIHLRLTPRLPLPGQQVLPGDWLRCEHVTPLIYDKHGLHYRLATTTVCRVDVTRGAADGKAPTCGCWMLIATGVLAPAVPLMVRGST